MTRRYTNILLLISVVCIPLIFYADLTQREDFIYPVFYLFLLPLAARAVPSIKFYQYYSVAGLLLFLPWVLSWPVYVGDMSVSELFSRTFLERLVIYALLGLISYVTSRAMHQEAQLGAFWNSVVDSLIVIDDRGTIKSVNPAVTKLFGYESSELIGQNIKMLMPPEYAAHHDGYLSDYKQTGNAKIIGIGREATGLRKNGLTFPLYLGVNKFQVGKNTYYGGIIRDLTAEKRSERALIEARDVAEKASRAKSAFLNSMSHEVRTPLNAILGFAQLVEVALDKDSYKTVQQHMGQIRKSGDHLLALLSDILDYASIDAGKLKINSEVMQAKEIVTMAVNMCMPMALKAKIKVHVVDASEQLDIIADRRRLLQAVMNLVSNAIKYNKPEGLVEIRLFSTEDGKVRLLIKDTGVGIAESATKLMFEPFNRLGREAMSIEGSGIGLSVTKALVDAMGGDLGYKSKLGQGSEFWIDVPKATHVQSAATQTVKLDSSNGVNRWKGGDPMISSRVPGSPASMSPSLTQGHVNILYIEDNLANAALMTSVMEHIGGVTFLCAESAEKGLQVAEEHPLDAVLMDLNLPGKDGFDAFSSLRLQKGKEGMPVYAVSADVRTGVVERTKMMGFRGFIAKPFKVDQIRSVVEELKSEITH